MRDQRTTSVRPNFVRDGVLLPMPTAIRALDLDELLAVHGGDDEGGGGDATTYTYDDGSTFTDNGNGSYSSTEATDYGVGSGGGNDFVGSGGTDVLSGGGGNDVLGGGGGSFDGGLGNTSFDDPTVGQPGWTGNTPTTSFDDPTVGQPGWTGNTGFTPTETPWAATTPLTAVQPSTHPDELALASGQLRSAFPNAPTREVVNEPGGGTSVTTVSPFGDREIIRTGADDKEISRTTFTTDQKTGLLTETIRSGSGVTSIETDPKTGNITTSVREGNYFYSTTVDAKGNVTGMISEIGADGKQTFTKHTGAPNGDVTYQKDLPNGVKMTGDFKDGVATYKESWSNWVYGSEKTTTVQDGRTVTVEKGDFGLGLLGSTSTTTTVEGADGSKSLTTELAPRLGHSWIATIAPKATFGANNGFGIDLSAGPNGWLARAGTELKGGENGFLFRADASGLPQLQGAGGGLTIAHTIDPLTGAAGYQFAANGKYAGRGLSGSVEFGEVPNGGDYMQTKIGASAFGSGVEGSYGYRQGAPGQPDLEQVTVGTSIPGVGKGTVGVVNENGERSWIGSITTWWGSTWGNVRDMVTGRYIQDKK